MSKYTDIQDEVIRRFRIEINENSKCKHRMHAHVRERMICKWNRKNSMSATFALFHEIGHVETFRGIMRRCESEFYATQWAIDLCREYNIEVPEGIVKKYQNYIWRELDRGLRRHGKNLPSKESMTLKV